MIRLGLPTGRLAILCLGAHPDDIEIGCGATLLELSAMRSLHATSVITTANPARSEEAHAAAAAFLGENVDVIVGSLPDGRLPAQWAELKELLEGVAASVRPDLILAPRRDDAHQDHRLLGELVTTVWRDSLVLHYEIPKWDGDRGEVTHYLPISDSTARRKVELLNKSFPSQVDRDWWDDEMFLGLMRIRGVECRARYAEAFVASKSVLGL